jgi:DNA polymerase III delta' subunit
MIELSSFVGNRELKESLNSYFLSGRLPHALILQGEDGLGKRTLAKWIAMAAVCRGDGSQIPCGHCSGCLRAKAMSHPDIRVITGSGASNSVSVESVRKMTEDAYRKPEEADRNVYLIFAGNTISEPAQNKLLKLVEEPPAGALFLITIRSADSLLPTIRSRAAVLTLRPVEPEEALAYLVERGAEREKAQEAVSLFGGNIGRAEHFLQGEDNASSQKIAASVAALVDQSDEHAMLAALAPVIRERALFGEVMAHMAAIFRDACVLRAGGAHSIGTAPQVSQRLSESLTKAQLAALPGICYTFQEYFQRNGNLTLLATVFCARIRNAVGK